MNDRNGFEILATASSRLQEEVRALQEQLREKEAELRILTQASAIARRVLGLSVPDSNLPDISKVEGETITGRRRKAFKILARANNGVLIIRESATPMVVAGLFKDRQAYLNQAYGLVKAMPEFEMMEMGKYRLRDDDIGGDAPEWTFPNGDDDTPKELMHFQNGIADASRLPL